MFLDIITNHSEQRNVITIRQDERVFVACMHTPGQARQVKAACGNLLSLHSLILFKYK